MDYNNKILKDSNGKSHLIVGVPLGSGGEGEIYKLSGEDGYVAKIYYQKYRTDERHKKLKAMLMTDYNKLPECAWPVSILYDGNEFCGFIMRNMSGYIGLIDFYVYDNRKKYTWAQYVTVAMNIAAVVSSLHELGHVVGDLNPNNILVDTKSCKVAFVDTDSYHIRGKDSVLYPCVVATPEFSAPELQGVDFKKVGNSRSVFNTNTDNFSLAVLIFRILMNGVHPFACTLNNKSVGEFQPVNNIKNGCCAFFSETNRKGELQRTLQAPDIDMLPVKIRIMFKAALLSKTKRPTGEEWFYELLKMRKTMCKCSINQRHEYYSELIECPWCSFEKEYRLKMQDMRNRIRNKKTDDRSKHGDFKTYDNTARIFTSTQPNNKYNANSANVSSPIFKSSGSISNSPGQQPESEEGWLGAVVGFLVTVGAILLIYGFFS